MNPQKISVLSQDWSSARKLFLRLSQQLEIPIDNIEESLPPTSSEEVLLSFASAIGEWASDDRIEELAHHNRNAGRAFLATALRLQRDPPFLQQVLVRICERRLNFEVRHVLGLKEALSRSFVCMSFAGSVVKLLGDRVALELS